MSGFVLEAGLPQKGGSVIIGEGYKSDLDSGLKSLGLEPLYMPANPNIDPRLSFHSDLSVLHLGGSRLMLAPHLADSDFSRCLCALGVNLIYADIKQSAVYPADTQLNVCPVGDTLFYCKGISYEPVLPYFSGKRLLTVKQGYCGCSICPIDGHSIITADRGIAIKARSVGLDVLLISPGYIELKGFDYGFIGGAAFKISHDCMAFTGAIDAHPDSESILTFLRERGIYPEFISKKPVFDIGCGIILTEK